MESVTEDNARAVQLEMVRKAKSADGMVPGILRIRAVDPQIAAPAVKIYQHLTMHRESPGAGCSVRWWHRSSLGSSGDGPDSASTRSRALPGQG